MYPDGYTGDGDSTSSEDGYEEEAPDVFRFLKGEVIEESPEEESNDDSDEGTISEENDGLTAEERLGGRTIRQLAENDVIRQVIRLVTR